MIRPSVRLYMPCFDVTWYFLRNKKSCKDMFKNIKYNCEYFKICKKTTFIYNPISFKK